MNRRSFLSATLGLSALGATLGAALSGCGSGGGTAPIGGAFSPGGVSPTPSPGSVGRGAAEGYAFLSADGREVLFFASQEAGTAAGLTPAEGVRAEIVGGSSAVTVGANGFVQLTGIAPGFQTLRLSGGTLSSPIDKALSVVPDAVLPLGTPVVAQTQAVDAARNALNSLPVGATGILGAELLAGADILATSTPLPAGVRIASALSTAPQQTTIERPAWFVYADFSPNARFGHEVAYLLVDAETGAVRAQAASSWPLLNGVSFYPNAEENKTSPDMVQAAATRATPAARTTPIEFGASAAAQALRDGTCRAADPDKARTHYLIVQGDSRADFAADPPRVMQALGTAPFPQTGTFRQIRTFEGAARPREQILNAFTDVRDAAKSGDTVVVYITTHGNLGDDFSSLEAIAAGYTMAFEANTMGQNSSVLTGDAFQKDTISPAEFDFRSCRACRIVLWIDTCYSGNWINVMRPQLEALPKKDILFLTSACQFLPAIAFESAQTLTDPQGTLFPVPTGGLFTTTLLEGLSLVRGTAAAESGADALAAAFPFADAKTLSINLAGYLVAPLPPGINLTNPNALTNEEKRAVRRAGLQLPQASRRPLGPDEVCGEGSETVTVK